MIKLNFFKNGPIPEPKVLPSSSAVHFIQSNTSAIVIATFQKVMEWVRPLFHYLFPNYVANAGKKSVSLKTKTQSLPKMIKEWGQNHRSLLKKTAGLVLLLGTMYTAYKLFSFSKVEEKIIPSFDSETSKQGFENESQKEIFSTWSALPLLLILPLIICIPSSVSKCKELAVNKVYYQVELGYYNALYKAVSELEPLSKIKELVEAGADYNFKGGYSKQVPILFQAVRMGNINVVKYFLTLDRLDINIAGEGHILPFALNNEHTEIAKLLLDMKQIKINELTGCNKWRRSALHIAIENGYNEIVRLLLDKKEIDINIQDDANATPLHAALKSDQVEIAKSLLAKKNIEINAKMRDLSKETGFNITALHLASKKGFEEIVKLLLVKAEIEVNAQDSKGNTPLHIAVENNQVKIIKHLIANNADLSIINNKGELAVDLAKSDEIKELLKNSKQPEEIKNQPTKKQLIPKVKEIKQEKKEIEKKAIEAFQKCFQEAEEKTIENLIPDDLQISKVEKESILSSLEEFKDDVPK